MYSTNYNDAYIHTYTGLYLLMLYTIGLAFPISLPGVRLSRDSAIPDLYLFPRAIFITSPIYVLDDSPE